MFALNLVLLALLALSTGQLGAPRYVQGQWIIDDENPIYEDPDELAVKAILPASPVEVVEQVTENRNLLTTVETYVIKQQDSDKAEEESAVWKFVLVAVVLLVSAVGSLSMAYYMCVWRGGRIHYQPQKQSFA